MKLQFPALKPKVSPVETSIYIPAYVYMQACSFQTVIDEDEVIDGEQPITTLKVR